MAVITSSERIDAFLWACTDCRVGGIAYSDQERKVQIAGHHCRKRKQ